MKLILLLILAYLLGSIPSGVWIGKLFFKKDIRQHGSGNTGTTNTFRVLGKTAGIVVLLMDILKGTLATCLPMIFHLSGTNPLWFGVCAILGHTFPIFVYSCIIFIVSLFCTSMVSLSSMISAALITLSTIVLPYVAPVILAKPNWLLTIIAFLVSSFIFYRHKDNIKRIRNHTESRIPFGLNSSKKKS